MNKENETRVSTESNELNISDKNSNINLENCCYYCNRPFTKELWYEECDPFRMIEGPVEIMILIDLSKIQFISHVNLGPDHRTTRSRNSLKITWVRLIDYKA
uniref:Uncharacterized protein n=1 Tax=Rhizophagus irregularis (strain DAOM 181602 / DAOM 197198 / MUCL 43194) TaxID=747089 RepID=U9TNF9_RHIID